MFRILIQITTSANRKDALTALGELFFQDQQLQELINRDGVYFPGLKRFDYENVDARLQNYGYPGYSFEDSLLHLRVIQGETRALFEALAVLLTDNNDSLATTLWQKGLMIGNLTEEQANLIRNVMQEKGAQVTLADQGDPSEYVVEGSASDRDNQVLPGLTIKAVDRDLRLEELLGEATTDQQGFYRITYTAQQFTRDEKDSADLVVRAYHPNQTEPAGESNIIFNAKPRETVNLTNIRPYRPPRLSEFERILAAIAPVIRDLRPIELNEDDISFLNGEFRDVSYVNKRSLRRIVQGAQFAQETGLLNEFFYGVSRRLAIQPYFELSDFLVLDVSEVRQALTVAFRRNFIPARLQDSLEDMLARFEQLKLERGFLEQRNTTGRLLRDDTNAALPGFTVQIFDLDAEPQPQNLGYDITNGQGLFTFTYITAAPNENAESPPPRNFRFEIAPPDSDTIHTTQIQIPFNQQGILDVAVPAEAIPEPQSPTLQELESTLDFQIPQNLRAYLANANLNTLADIRRVSGLYRLDDLPVAADDPALIMLQGQADLSILSSDIQQNAYLINKGFAHIDAIANRTRAEFVNAVQEELGDYRAAELHVKASAEKRYLNNILMGLKADKANGLPSFLPEITNSPFPEWFKETCQCRDCDSAVSAVAYCADLSDYVVQHVFRDGEPITLRYLTNTFHQPFDDLPASCESQDTKVRQVRICVEVLRSYLGLEAEQPSEQNYRQNAYTTLLTKLGTSYTDLRLARTDEKQRQNLGNRLGMTLTPERFESLFLEPEAITEQGLEELFGLADTTRNPLSEGAKFGDDANQILEWNLDRVEWNHNTDANGRVHIALSNPDGPGYRIDIYRDISRDPEHLVASGEFASRRDTVAVTAENQSGLSGIFEIDFSEATDAITIAAVPLFTSWRLEGLRDLWKTQDWPTDAYWDSVAGSDGDSEADASETSLLPIIDPDVIGPDDFRAPFPTDSDGDPTQAFDLWIKRRRWVDDRLEALQEIRAARSAEGDAAAFMAVVNQMAEPVTYSYSGESDQTSWPDDINLDVLKDSLAIADEVEATQERIQTELYLTLASFNRLIELKTKAESDEAVKPEEWEEVVSILVQARKQGFRSFWQKEEKVLQESLEPVMADSSLRRSIFSPRYFWKSLREPQMGNWPPQIPENRPLIDPDQIELKDLPEPTIGQAAIALFNSRVEQRQNILRDLREESRKENGLIAVVKLIYGETPPEPAPETETDWKTYLETIRDDLSSSDPAEVDAAKTKIEALHLTEEDFARLMAIEAQESPTQAAWDEIYPVLIQAFKQEKGLLTTWRTEEEEQGLVTNYWRALKAQLPKWRASASDRQQWHQALHRRSQASIIDPDVINLDHLRQVQIPDDLEKYPWGQLWLERLQFLISYYDLFVNSTDTRTADGFNDILIETLFDETTRRNIPENDLIDHLVALDKRRTQGEDIRDRLAQLHLTSPAFKHLMRVHALLAEDPPVPVLDSEWEEANNILVQVRKQREFADWQRQEQKEEIILSQDHFQIPEPAALTFPPPEPQPLTKWRATWRDRKDWEDKLETRIEQQETLLTAMQVAVSETEEATLPKLRDTLIRASDEVDGDVDAKAKLLTDKLLIDMKADGCQLTTRISQAIATLQGLVWSLRTGQLQDTYADLELDSDDFEDEWRWMGSYASWRAAMFVHMYPENVQHPPLRRELTSAFRELVNTTRSSRFNPQQACEAANAYAEYFRDVATLEIEATCQARTRVVHSDCQTRKEESSKYRNLFYMFARGGATNKVYWSTYDSKDKSGHAQTFWETIPGIKNATKIVGGVPYKFDENKRYIFLFVLSQEGGQQQLILTKYDLEQERIDNEPIELELFQDRTVSNIVSVQSQPDGDQLERQLPKLFIQTVEGSFYIRDLNQEGTDWKEPSNNSNGSEGQDEWAQFKVGTDSEVKNAKTVYSVLYIPIIPGGAANYYIFFANSAGELKYTKIGFNPGGLNTHVDITIGNFDWVGIYWTSEDKFAFFYKRISRTLYKIYDVTDNTISRQKNFIPNLDQIALGFSSVNLDNLIKVIRVLSGSKQGFHISKVRKFRSSEYDLVEQFRFHVAPNLEGITSARYLSTPSFFFDITENLNQHERQLKRQAVADIFLDNQDTPASNLTYLKEAYYLVPIQIFLQLQRRGHYVKALDWVRTVYDYSVPEDQRAIYPKLDEEPEPSYARAEDWLSDPLNPYAIADNRPGVHCRAVVQQIVRCLLDYADSEFTRDTAESLPRARELYRTALDLLNIEKLQQKLGRCESLIGVIGIEIGEAIESRPIYTGIYDELVRNLRVIGDLDVLEETTTSIREALTSGGSLEERMGTSLRIASEARAVPKPPPRLGKVVSEFPGHLTRAHTALASQPSLVEGIRQVGKAAGADFSQAVATVAGIDESQLETSQVSLDWLRSPAIGNTTNQEQLGAVHINRQFHTHVPAPSFFFCIPQNPILKALRLRAELNLYKLRTCRNIAGLERQINPYAAPTDTTTGLPQIGAGGQLVLPGAHGIKPTKYRFSVLIERAKQWVQLANQVESAMLASIEKGENAQFTLLKARQEVELARQGIRLQNLRLDEAENGVELAELQQERSQIQLDHYEKLLEEGLLFQEEFSLTLLELAAGVYGIAALAASANLIDQAQVFGFTASGLSTAASRFSQAASYERRKQEWQLQRDLSSQDVLIGDQQITLAVDRVRIVGQELEIAEIQTEHARETVEFLTNKFTTAELYDWMSDVLEGVYSYFLHEATSTAKLAENQLAFERQEVPPAIIQADYWEAPTNTLLSSSEGNAPDRRGLTGSARLLRDIYELDQYAFDTDKRKLQLTKNISLARLDPFAFSQFRQTGVLRFATPMDLFDQDFPGHYLRLIKQVRVSVIALIPPTEGIKATLSTIGVSRVVLEDTIFQTVTNQRGTEEVALTSPQNATGLFEFQQQSDMLLPFEGMGVAAEWVFALPKAANQLDYSSIADVLLTIDYTALNSFVYRQQVVRELSNEFSADRPFSFRNQFADAWYDFHNPDLTATPMTVTFQTRREDFPPNLQKLKIQEILLYFVGAKGLPVKAPIVQLEFTPQDGSGPVGGEAGNADDADTTDVDGVISTRRSNGAAWQAITNDNLPIGEWKLKLPESMRSVFEQEDIDDILFVITYKGTTPK